MKIQYTKYAGCSKALLRVKFVARNADIRHDKSSQVNNLISYLKTLEKEEENKPQ